jgi:hypothetical protein
MMLPVTPDVFHRIELRCIGRQEIDFYSSLRFPHEISDQATAMTTQPVPNHKKVAWNVAHQMRKEFHNLRTANGSRKQPEIESPPGDARNRRNSLPVEMELKHWCLPARRPGTAAVRPFAQTAFVHKYNGLPLQLGFFLSSGHRLFFHRRILSSSRSIARAVGLWQLHPSFCSTFQTCPEWYLIPHSCSIRSATLQAVQRPVSYPSASGPRFRASRIRIRSSSERRALRPALPAFLSPEMPDSLNCRAQRLTDCRCTPTRRATSASWIPFFSSLAACIRRLSSTSKLRFTPAGFPMHESIQQTLKNVTILCGIQ